MNRLERLHAILIHLQSKKSVTAQEIADRFHTSVRTVYRDIRALEEAGIPVGAEAGKGYFIMEGYYLPPVIFSREEAGAIVMGAKLIEHHTDQSIKNHFTQALYKIKSVLKYQDKDYLESLEKNIDVYTISAPVREEFPNAFLTDIQTALATRRVLRFDYYANYNHQFTTREVEPLGLCYYNGHWHLIAYCRLREALRDFRPDRIMKLSIRETTFNPEVHESYRSHMDEVLRGSELREAVVIFAPDIAQYIREQKFYYGFMEERPVDNGVEMKFTVPTYEYFARWLLTFGAKVSIVEPEPLKTLMHKFSQELFQHHQLSSTVVAEK